MIKRDELAALTPQLGVELVALEIDPGNPGMPDPALIPARMRELREAGVTWVYLGSSSFLNTNGELFTSSAVENGIAIVSPYESLVRENRHCSRSPRGWRTSGASPPTGPAHPARRRDARRPAHSPGDRLRLCRQHGGRHKLGRFPPFAFLQVAEAVRQ